MATKPAKALLHEFFQPLQGTPLFSIRPGPPPPAPPHFLCTLTIPAITTAQYSFASQEFTGEANNKRAAEHAASQAALNFLNSLRPGGKMQTPQTIAAAETVGRIDDTYDNGHTEDGNSPDELTAELGGRSIMDLNPVELKEELLKALEKNSSLKAALSYDQERRSQAAKLLLGLQALPAL